MTTITLKTCAWWAGSAPSTGEKSRYYVRIVPIMIRRLAASWMGLGASHPFGWSALLPQDRRLLAIHHAVRGFGGAHARRLPDRIGRRFGTASQLAWSALLLSTGVSRRLP